LEKGTKGIHTSKTYDPTSNFKIETIKDKQQFKGFELEEMRLADYTNNSAEISDLKQST
jgi:hypothetical protein